MSLAMTSSSGFPTSGSYSSIWQRLLNLGSGMFATSGAGGNVNIQAQWQTTCAPPQQGRSAGHDISPELMLSPEYCTNHYLTGLLISQLAWSFEQNKTFRSRTIILIRNLLWKHSIDSRYFGKPVQSRIAALYFPLVAMVVQSPLLQWVHVENQGGYQGQQQSPRLSIGGGHTRDSDLRISSGAGSVNTSARGSLSSATGHRVTWAQDKNHAGGSAFGSPSLSNYSIGGGTIMSFDAGIIDYPRKGSISSGSTLIGPQNQTSQLVGNFDHPDNASSPQNGTCVDPDETPRPSPSATQTAPSIQYHPSTVSSNAASSLIALGCGPLSSAAGGALATKEVRDILLSTLFVFKHAGRDLLWVWWRRLNEPQLLSFFNFLELALCLFRYRGKCEISRTSSRLRASAGKANRLASQSKYFTTLESQHRMPTDYEDQMESTYEGYLAQEISVTVIDLVASFCSCYKEVLRVSRGDNMLLKKIFSIYVSLLNRQSSEIVISHVYAVLRLFIKEFPNVLFKGKPDYVSQICQEVLKCCNSSIETIRKEGCELLYLLMRANFEATNRTNFTRVHLQAVISLSDLLGDQVNLNSATFHQSLSYLNQTAVSDRSMRHTSLVSEIKEVVRRMRTVLMATAALKDHADDPEMLADLQYSLAESYSATPVLRKTWLESLARLQSLHGNLPEASYCHLHSTGLVCEYLKRRAHLEFGCDAFRSVSDNIEPDERLMKNDYNTEDVPFGVDTFLAKIDECSDWLRKCDRFEHLGYLYRLVIPIYEQRGDYMALMEIYKILHNANSNILEMNKSGRRKLGCYFRVGFFSQNHFEELHTKQFIYKEPKYCSLAEFSEKLKALYECKFGSSCIRLITESPPVDVDSLDPQLAYIQITYVLPFTRDIERNSGPGWKRHSGTSSRHASLNFSQSAPRHLSGIPNGHVESSAAPVSYRSSSSQGSTGSYNQFICQLRSQQTTSEYYRNTNVSKFYFDAPFNEDGAGSNRCAVIGQCKRRTILTTNKTFPYVVRRIHVASEETIDYSPLEAAIDEMHERTTELSDIVFNEVKDLKRLQLRLQGAVQVTVNAGPLAYAQAFVTEDQVKKYGADKLGQLKDAFRHFLFICHNALELNGQLVASDQIEYHRSLVDNFKTLVVKLCEIFQQDMLTVKMEDSPSRISTHSVNMMQL